LALTTISLVRQPRACAARLFGRAGERCIGEHRTRGCDVAHTTAVQCRTLKRDPGCCAAAGLRVRFWRNTSCRAGSLAAIPTPGS
jgi:hypothetical protein